MDTKQCHIMIESGHGLSAIGTNDPGAVKNGRTERDMNVIMAKKIAEKLSGKINIHFVGVETKANLRQKTSYINRLIKENKFTNCASLSLHMNSSVSSQPHGFELWHKHKDVNSIDLALEVDKSLKEYKTIEARPKSILDTSLNRWGRLYFDSFICPSILIEVGFISNLNDVLTIEKNTDRIAEAIGHGILEYFRSK